MFGRRNPETSTEAPKPVEARTFRERPDFATMAKENRAAFSQKYESRWSKIKQGWGTAKESVKDFVFTIKPRTAYAAGLAKDASVEGAQFVAGKTVEAGKAVGRAGVAGIEKGVEGIKYTQDQVRKVGQGIEHGVEVGVVGAVEGAKAVGRGATAAKEFGSGAVNTGFETVRSGLDYVDEKGQQGVEMARAGIDRGVEAGKAVGRGAKATAEFGLGVAVVGAEAVGSAGKYVYEKGQQNAEAAWEGIQRGVESAQNKYTEVRSGITEKFRRTKEAVLNRAEMLRYKGEQAKINALRALADNLERRAGLNEQKIQARVQERLKALGISTAESEPSESSQAA